MKRQLTCMAGFLLLLPLQLLALVPTENKRRLCEGWEFIKQDMGSVWEVMRPVPGMGKPEAVPLWESVTLPHCFNETDAVDPDVNYYQGAGWYRTCLDVQNPYQDGHTLLEFEGAGQITEVYVYTRKVATHVGGYDEWTADITEAVNEFRQNPICQSHFGGCIPVAVRCTNARNTELIPSDMSDFNLYGGLYRYVNLVYLPQVHIKRIQIDAQVDAKGRLGTADICIETNGTAEIKATIFAPDGKTYPLTLIGSKATFRQEKPRLWSTEQPCLYTCRVEMVTQGDTIRISERFGFRHFGFKEYGPFYLNGKRLLLRGTHRHEDHAGVGAALTEKMMRKEMKQIKDMGANFIRLGHYQQSDLILRLCDELGILVWEEIPWCRGGLGGEAYRSQAKRMLANMIDRHRNHPSIILWGLGNENDWPGDFIEFDKQQIRSFMSELHQLSHELDDSRLTCIRRCDFCKDIVDVYSPSIWAGWYSRYYRDYQAMEKVEQESVPRFFHAEWGGDSHAGRHTEDNRFYEVEAGDRNGDWSETYIVRLFDWHLKEQEKMPWLTGTAFWTFKDFSTPLRPDNPIPYVNQKGVVQRDGTPKESYYVFQSYWSDSPMVHIYGHSWPVRWGKADETKEVWVYSNCLEVELLVNGISQGIRQRDSQDFPAAGLRWRVLLKEGTNHIQAIAHKGKEICTDEIVQEYQTTRWGSPAQISLSTMDSEGQRYLLAELLDAKGTRCLDGNLFVRFNSTHSDALVINQGTATGSQRIQMANGRAIVRLNSTFDKAFIVNVYAEKENIEDAFIHITPKAVF